MADDLHAWWAPAGTDPADTTAWQPLGHLADDGLQILDDLPHDHTPFNRAPFTITLTRRAGRWSWSGWRLLTGTTHPDARRTKTEYHRRRRNRR
ncbi:hypothetical protein [Streptosporangium canum]|uniref:hypothetical protein n=1 Tax=Streptosporangium canum TaxID=324952 RepID=UPI0033A2B594